MGKKTEAILQHVADALATASQAEIASTVSSFLLEIKAKEIVSIDGLSVETTVGGGTTPEKTLATRLGRVLNVPDSDLKASLIQNISSSITTPVASSCVAFAINSVCIRLANITNNVSITNLKVTQTASAQILKCVQNVAVNNNTLRGYLEENEDQISDVTPFKPSSTVCPDPERARVFLFASVAGSICTLLVIVAVFMFWFM